MMGPPPFESKRSRAPPSAPSAASPAPVRRTGSTGAPPPSAAFRSGGSSALNASGAAVALPQRWSQHEPSDPESARATANAVYMASSAAANRESSRYSSGNASIASSKSAFEDDDMQGEDPYTKEFEIGSYDSNEDVDEDIGKEYDKHKHDSIRQEALRMLEVADADEHYSVHRTITGGFAAEARSLGSKKPRALSGLSFTATRNSNKPRYSDFASANSTNNQDDYEYGDQSVVDVIGMEQRAMGNAEASPSGKDGNSWSSRYSIDSTLLAMSGGAMKMSRGSSTAGADTSNERFSARNLFGSSPAKSPQVFGSGFSFRQQHVFGKQGVSASNNLQQSWTDAGALDGTLSSSGNRLKTWQEQLLHKKRQQRRLLFCLCFALLCIIVPLASLVGHQEKTIAALEIPPDGTQGSVTFYVTADVPYNVDEEAKLIHDLAEIVPTTSFAVHLGNIQNAALNQCESSNYRHVADLMEVHSPETIFVVPGQEDWSNCPDPKLAWAEWYKQFQFYNNRWDDTENKEEFEVFHQKHQLENWAFIHREVLFLGVHAVNGAVHNKTESDQRNERNYEWVSGMANARLSDIRAMVIFGNAKPGYNGSVVFFAQLEDFMRTFDLPTMYVHAASGEGGIEQYKPFIDTPHFYSVQVETGLDTPPLRMNVGYAENPFLIG